MRRNILIATATFLLVVGALLSSFALRAQGHGAGEDPPWVGPDGFVQQDDLPDEFPVYGPDGEVIDMRSKAELLSQDGDAEADPE